MLLALFLKFICFSITMLSPRCLLVESIRDINERTFYFILPQKEHQHDLRLINILNLHFVNESISFSSFFISIKMIFVDRSNRYNC